MIAGIGLDLVAVGELEIEIDAKREPWLERVFTAGEREYCGMQPDAYRHFAGALAAKEAALKALGVGLTEETDWQNVEVIHENGKPVVKLNGGALKMANSLMIESVMVSITHTKEQAAAVVILERKMG